MSADDRGHGCGGGRAAIVFEIEAGSASAFAFARQVVVIGVQKRDCAAQTRSRHLDMVWGMCCVESAPSALVESPAFFR